MGPQEVNIAHLQTWRRLLKLTGVRHPEHIGECIDVYVEPEIIICLRRVTISLRKLTEEGAHPGLVEATELVIRTGQIFVVQELPSEVSALRDKALGLELAVPPSQLKLV